MEIHMTPDQFKALLDGPAPSAPATPSAPAAGPDPFAYLNQPQQAAQAPEQLFGPALSAAPQGPIPGRALVGNEVPPEATASEPGLVSRIAGDIGTGIAELPRAVVKGARDAVQESANFGAEAAGWATGSDLKAPQLPEIDAPKSTTGKLATSVSQFIVGMVGLGKVVRPLEAAAGLAKAGRAAKIATESAKAATVGAVAFDPTAERLGNIVESIPGLSNPFSRFLMAQPGDSRALGRMKNALESLGMDAALVGGLMAGTKAFRSVQDWKAGKITAEQMQKDLAAAEEAAVAVEKAPLAPDLPPTTRGAAEPITAAPEGAAAAEPSAGSLFEPQPGAALAQSPAALPTSVRPRDVLELGSAPKADALEEGVSAAAQPSRGVTLSDEQVAAIAAGARSDMDAFATAGSWDAALDAGHVFGRGERVPWEKLLARHDATAGEPPLSAFMARVADAIESDINKARGGTAEGVMSDAMVDAAMRQRLALWGDDPAEFLGQLSSAGANARTAVAQYDAALVVGQRAVQDAYAAAERINAGDLSAWGGNRELATNSLRDMLSVVATINGNAEALKASFGRGLRRARFALDPADISNLMKLDGDQLSKALSETRGDPQLLKRLAAPALWQRLQDPAQWLLVNNLLWGWKTHAVNALSNLYMGAARPMERILGSFALSGEEAVRTRRAAWRQYAYMKASLEEGLQSALQAWHAGDSILSPHSVESTVQQGINPAAINFKSPDNIPAFLHNVGVAAVKTLGLPTRAMATMDELFKQVTYRSKVLADAHVQGAAAGLDEAALTAYVRRALLEAFDEAGRGINEAALREARIATFSQELLPGSVGAHSQTFAANVPLVRLIVPFLRTPFNVMRYGVKMTPLLSFAQQEYRQMLSGAMGQEAKAQAVGQASIGTLFMGVAAMAAFSGRLTGAGPTDPKLKQAAMQSGWQPYSIVSVGADGRKQYSSFSKLDPIAMPLGIIADLVDALSQADDEAYIAENVATVGTAVLFGFIKMMGDKTYTRSISELVNAINDPDTKMDKAASQLAVSFVPASSLLRSVKEGVFDQHMREARTLADRLLAITPGLSDKVPPKRDVWGEPVTVSRGLWVTNERDLVDAEVRRMATEGGFVMGPPSPTVSGVDLRDVTMVNGRNAYDQYQEWASRPSKNGRSVKETAARIMQGAAYQRAPDGSPATRGTRQWMIAGMLHRHREMAARRLRGDKNVRDALLQSQRDVAAAYAASKAPKTPAQMGRDTMSNLGQAFGVDLDGLLPKR